MSWNCIFGDGRLTSPLHSLILLILQNDGNRATMKIDDKRDPKVEQVWRSYLTTGKPPKDVDLPWYESPTMRTFARRLPSDPRCQVCYYPFGGLGGSIVRSFFRLERSKMNPHLCNICERFANSNPGGAELEVALLFADIRGSTPLAATMDALGQERL